MFGLTKVIINTSGFISSEQATRTRWLASDFSSLRTFLMLNLGILTMRFPIFDEYPNI